MSHNVSIVGDQETARTRDECADQRAMMLACCGVKSVLELCVGPSLKTLERAYGAVGISVIGNDIDRRWPQIYPAGHWRIGDALSISWEGVDAVVFAPPLSVGCTGRREDALSVSKVRPAYVDALTRFSRDHQAPRLAVFVLPARATATRQDRGELHHLLRRIACAGYRSELIQLVADRRGIVKYNDLIIY